MNLDKEKQDYLNEQAEKDAVVSETEEAAETSNEDAKQSQSEEVDTETKKESGLFRFFRKLFEF